MLSFPVGVKAIRQFLPGGTSEYKLTHVEVGELGRILLIPNADGRTEIRHEVFDGSGDMLHQRRLELLTEVERTVSAAFARAGIPMK